MGLMLNRRRMMGGESLPYDAEIEYLESSGTQWIDTEIYMESDMCITCDIEFNESSNRWGRLFGASKSAATNGVVVACYNTSEQICPRFLYPTEYRLPTYTSGKYTFVVDDYNSVIRVFGGNNYDESVTIPKWVYLSGLGTFCLWNFGGVNKIDGGVCKIYSFRIEKNGLYVLDLIPVRVGNIGYMYDKVSKQLFGNAGTGSFILGPDKGTAVTITQQQQHEMYGE